GPLMITPGGRHHQERNGRLRAGGPEGENPPLAPSTVKSSHNTERSNQRKERHGQGRNNSAVICDSGAGNRNSGAALFCAGRGVGFRCSGVCVKRRGCSSRRAPYSNSAIWTAFRAAPLSN